MNLFASFILLLIAVFALIILLDVIQLYVSSVSVFDVLLSNATSNMTGGAFNATEYDIMTSLGWAWNVLDIATAIAVIAATLAVFAYARRR